MKKYFLAILCIVSFQYLFAQEKFGVSNTILKLNFLNPGFTFEKSFSEKYTISIDANLSFSSTIRTINNRNKLNVFVFPFIRPQFRYYYNLEKRGAKGKSIYKNSGSYLAINSSYYFKSINHEFYLSAFDGLNLGGTWGFQKTYKSNLNLGANLGLAYNFSNNVKQNVVPIINFTLGCVIGK